MTILITGATGLIGHAITRSYLADHEDVRILTRDPERARAIFGTDVDVLAWLPDQQELPSGAVDGVDVVFHLMGEPVSGRWTAAKIRRLVDLRVGSAAKLANAVRGKRPG